MSLNAKQRENQEIELIQRYKNQLLLAPKPIVATPTAPTDAPKPEGEAKPAPNALQASASKIIEINSASTNF